MKILGLVGGTTWISTIDHYRLINQKVNELLGGLNSAKIILYSVNFEEFRPPVDPRDWHLLSAKFIAAAQKLEKAGADGIIFCANTPHLIADAVRKKIGISIIHIAEAVAEELSSRQIKKVILLGTRTTMEQNFLKVNCCKNRSKCLFQENWTGNLFMMLFLMKWEKVFFLLKPKRDSCGSLMN